MKAFDTQINRFREGLNEAVEQLDSHYDDMRSAAEERLGDLFDPTDYPPTLIGMFVIEHDFPSVEPPAYLRQLNPELYEQECRRVQARFDEAVRLAEQAFIDELSQLVSHLTDGTTGRSRRRAAENIPRYGG